LLRAKSLEHFLIGAKAANCVLRILDGQIGPQNRQDYYRTGWEPVELNIPHAGGATSCSSLAAVWSNLFSLSLDATVETGSAVSTFAPTDLDQERKSRTMSGSRRSSSNLIDLTSGHDPLFANWPVQTVFTYFCIEQITTMPWKRSLENSILRAGPARVIISSPPWIC